ncbi:MAG: GNAT family N-acetyltransferase, partial [Gammaproteobacteria bacterium]
LIADLGGRRVELRDLMPDDVCPDESSEWDAWDAEWLPAHEQPQQYRAVVVFDQQIVGTLSWHAVPYGPTARSRAWSLGIGLAQPFRGRGIGTVAQRLLSDHLLQMAHRVEASTDIMNVAEQRALEKAGFTREGVLRGAQFRADGRHHDLVMFSRIRATAS